MKIYLLYEEYGNRNYGTIENYCAYPYKNYEDVIQRLMYESSSPKSLIEEKLKDGGYFDSGSFLYHIEESELL